MKKAIQIISGVVIAVGFTVIAGTAGSSDLGLISIGTTVENSLIGLIIMIGGVLLIKIGGLAYGE